MVQVWDDKYLGNSDFAYIYPFFTLEEINAMEIAFVKLLQYQVCGKTVWLVMTLLYI